MGKETGETAHVERWNNTLRQRLARFVRVALSFSKSVVMHEACLLLFLSRYNRERVIPAQVSHYLRDDLNAYFQQLHGLLSVMPLTLKPIQNVRALFAFEANK